MGDASRARASSWRVAALGRVALDPKIVAVLLFAVLVAAVSGGALVRYGTQERQRGWVIGGWAIILVWCGSTLYVLVRYALAQG